jgi:parallel beta-helix repeat protein
MLSKNKFSLLSLIVLFTLVVSLVFPMTALADDGAPTPAPDSPAVETSAPSVGTDAVSTEPAATDVPANPTDVAPSDVTTDVPADPTEVVPMDAAATDAPVDPTATADVSTPAPVEPTADVVAALNDVGAVLLDENGNAVPLGSQQAADALAETDPWFDAGLGVIVGYSKTGVCAAVVTECHTSSTPIQAAINDVRSTSKTISIEAGTYTEQIVISKSLTLVGAGQGLTTIQFPVAPGTYAPMSIGPYYAVVEVNNGATVSLSNLTIAGPGPGGCGTLHYGVFVGGGATLNVSDTTVDNIRDNAVSGCQNGVSIRIGSAALGQVGHATIKNTTVTNYQKGGIVIDGAGTTATVTDNFVQPYLADHVITAANGIQVSRGAVATVTGNIIKDNLCDTVPGGCVGSDPLTRVTSAGVLLYNSGDGTIISDNEISNNDIGIYNYTTGTTTINGNNIFNNRFEGIFLDQGNSMVTGNTITGSLIGVAGVSFNGNTANSQGTLSGNTITGNDVGIKLIDEINTDAYVPSLAAHNNSIYGNTYGVNNTLTSIVDATNNWWGNASGPQDSSTVPDICGLPLTNPTGTGDAASMCVLYNPWLLVNPFAGSVTLPPSGGEGGNGRGQTESSTGFPVIAVTGGQETTISCDSQSMTIKIEDIKVTLTALCGYDVVLEKVSKENLPGTLGQGINLEDGVLIKILKGGKVIDTLPVDASLSVAYPKPGSNDTSVLTWNGNGWQEQVSHIDGNNIVANLTAPSTLVLVTH